MRNTLLTLLASAALALAVGCESKESSTATPATPGQATPSTGASAEHKKLTIAMRVSERVYVMGHGQIVFEGTPEDLRRAPDVRREWLEVN